MPKTTAPTADQLRACDSREAAAALLPLKLSRPQLLAIAAEFDMGATSRSNKAELIERIVHRAVGQRLNHEAILNSCGPRPSELIAAAMSPADRALLATCATNNHARSAATIRATTAAILQGHTGDPAGLADLVGAAQELVAIASRMAHAHR